MIELANVSAKIADYKCFGAEPYEFDRILPINLIVGRNNSGKSALLDLIDFLCAPKNLDRLGHQGRRPKAILSGALADAELQQVFSPNMSGGRIQAANHWEYGRRWIGKDFSWIVTDGGQLAYHSSDPPFDRNVVADIRTC